mgnify:FL=1|jgi:hypothetical protein
MKENSYKYIINNLLIENTEKSLFKLVEIYKDIKFRKEYMLYDSELLYCYIALCVYRIEKTHDITNHILSMGYDLKSIADLICRLKFLIWRIEFDDGACNVNELLEYIKYNRLSDVAVEEIINQSSFHKEKIYKRIAAYGE